MLLACHCHVIDMLLVPRSCPDLRPCYCHVIAMSLPCDRHDVFFVIAMPCHCQGIAMSLPSYFQGMLDMSLLPCHCHVNCQIIVMILPGWCLGITLSVVSWNCHVSAMSLPCHCRVIAILLLWYCHVIAMCLPCYATLLPCQWNVIAM